MLPKLIQESVITVNKRGSAYLIALITLVTGMTLGLALLRSSGAITIQGRSTIDAGIASHLADAGMAYGYWLYRYRIQSLPLSEEITLDTGTASVQINNYDPLPDTVKITSIGTYRDTSVSRLRIVRKRARPFEMAFCWRAPSEPYSYSPSVNSLRTGRNGQDGDVWINGTFAYGTLLDVDGDVFAKSVSFTNMWVTGRIVTRNEKITFPTINANYYKNKAQQNNTYYGYYDPSLGGLYPAVTLTWGQADIDDKLNSVSDLGTIYVDANLIIPENVEVSGRHLLVIAGSLILKGDIHYKNPSSDKLVVLITDPGSLMADERPSYYLDGFYYIHKNSTSSGMPGGWLCAYNATFGQGGVAFDSKGGGGTYTAISDPDFRNTDLPVKMCLPGYIDY